MKPTATVLVGLPASGKSTRVIEMNPHAFIYSTDRYIENVASSTLRNYDEVFNDVIKQATENMNILLQSAIHDGKDIIFDQTNLSIKKRSKIINRMKQVGYSVECECFLPPETVEDIAEWNRRLHSRPGKTIDEGIIANMVKTYTIPTIEEGFDSLVYWNIYGDLCDTP